MDNGLTFGQWLKRRRRGLGLTQRALGEKLGYASDTIRKVESDELRPSRQLAERLAQAMEVEPSEWERLVRFARDEAELDASPLPTQTVLLPGYAAPAAAPRHNLPAALTHFIGRETEIAELRGLLHTRRLVTLTGAGGMGKSRLSLEVAASLLASYPDGAWLVELAGLADPARVPQAVARVLGVSEIAGQPLLETLATYLRPKTLLLLLDNCEHLIDACAALVLALLQAAPDLRLFATSREALAVDGEALYDLPSLSVPDAGEHAPPEQLERYEAVRLFMDRATLALPSFKLTQANAAAVTVVCRGLDGMPLAIELAAARIRLLQVEQIAARLDDRFRLLAGGSRTAVPRHQTLHALIDWSHALLPETEQILLRRLAIFAGGFTLEAAEQVAAGEGVEAGEVLDLLAGLVSKSLVRLSDVAAAQRPRYRMLETIRAYAWDRLDEAGERELLHARHLDDCITLAEAGWPRLFRAEQLEWLARFEAEHDNLRAALAWALKARPQQAVRLAASLWQFWNHSGHWSEGRDWLEQCLQATEADVQGPTHARAWLGLAQLTFNRDATRQAAASFQQALARARTVGDVWGEVYALLRCADWQVMQGNPAGADAINHEALQLARQAGDLWGQTRATHALAFAALTHGQLTTAATLAEEALTLQAEVGDRSVLAGILNVLSTIAQVRGEFARAAQLGQRRLAVAREVGGWANSGVGLAWLGMLAYQQGDYAQATQYLDESLATARELRRAGLTHWCLVLLGSLASQLGDCATTEAHLAAARELARTLDEKTVWVDMFVYGGLAAYTCGDLAQANEQLRRGLPLVRETGFSSEWNAACYGLAQCCYYLGDYAEVSLLLEEGLAHSRATEDAFWLARLLLVQGRLALHQADLDPAHQTFQERLILLRGMGAKPCIAEALELGAALALSQGHPEHSGRLLGAAEVLREQIGVPIPAVERPEYDATVAGCEKLGQRAFAAAYIEGQGLSFEQAVELALGPAATKAPGPTSPSSSQ